MALDDKAFRYFDPRTGKFEIETGEYEILVAASVSDVKLTTTVSVADTVEPAPFEDLPSYAAADVTNVSDAEFATLLDRPIPKGSWTKHNVIGQFCTNCPIF